MNFCSDNVVGASPEIMAALVECNYGVAMPYGNDDRSLYLNNLFSELFETEVLVFPVATGTAANALALSVMSTPYGAIYCHHESHINCDECGAPEFFTGGAKLITLQGEHGKINTKDLADAIARAGIGIVHHVQPAAVSLSQATEAGTTYSIQEVAQIAKVAHSHELPLHMDGARFANAVATLECTPADITWRAGVDVLSFGATKNGALAAEAVVFFNRKLAHTFSYRRKRSGHLFSKMQFLSVQLEAYVKNKLWLKNATHANQMAKNLAEKLTQLPRITLCHPVEINEIFVQMPEQVIINLLADGFQFYRWYDEDSTTVRLVTAFNTEEKDIAALVDAVRKYCSQDLSLTVG
ncbi:threonine aldolase family protein [Scytonema sp. NUACC26]|uniref:threonine aldolase family protein n=1 Tax=Scytonema sp. NUACC26 TaxID=3140176 RepID=UPI0034DBEBC9